MMIDEMWAKLDTLTHFDAINEGLAELSNLYDDPNSRLRVEILIHSLVLYTPSLNKVFLRSGLLPAKIVLAYFPKPKESEFDDIDRYVVIDPRAGSPELKGTRSNGMTRRIVEPDYWEILIRLSALREWVENG